VALQSKEQALNTRTLDGGFKSRWCLSLVSLSCFPVQIEPSGGVDHSSMK
jgi:hypothetical protein